MGYGFPAAIGAWLALQTTGGQARPDQQARQTAGGQVWCITSDGSFQMNMQEMATAVAQRVPVKLLIINNGYLGMVRQWQELFYQRRYSGVRLERGLPDFVKLAEAFGAAGLRVTREEEVLPAIQKAMQVSDRPFLVDVWVEEEENVYPMVPAGGSIDQMMVD
jgi:acetolactate synthase-1/2/3 large subunit